METRIAYIQAGMTGFQPVESRQVLSWVLAVIFPFRPPTTPKQLLCYTVFTLLPRFARDAVVPEFGPDSSPHFLPAVLFSVNPNVSGMEHRTCV
jgi:hypothetical protein